MKISEEFVVKAMDFFEKVVDSKAKSNAALIWDKKTNHLIPGVLAVMNSKVLVGDSLEELHNLCGSSCILVMCYMQGCNVMAKVVSEGETIDDFEQCINSVSFHAVPNNFIS